MGKRRAQAQAHEAYQDEAIAGSQQPAYAAPPQQAPPAPAQGGMAPDAISQLKELGQLHEQGVLTDEEFAQQKAKLLG